MHYIFTQSHHALSAWLDHGINSFTIDNLTKERLRISDLLAGNDFDWIILSKNWRVVLEHECLMTSKNRDVGAHRNGMIFRRNDEGWQYMESLSYDSFWYISIIYRNDLPFPPYDIVEE